MSLIGNSRSGKSFHFFPISAMLRSRKQIGDT